MNCEKEIPMKYVNDLSKTKHKVLLYASLTTFLMKQTVQKYIPETLRGQSHISVHQQYSAEINTLIVTESFVALVVDFNSKIRI